MKHYGLVQAVELSSRTCDLFDKPLQINKLIREVELLNFICFYTY